MIENNYRFLIKSMKREIEGSRKLIETFRKDAEADREKGFDYGEGLYRGWMLSLIKRIKDLENTLEILKEDEDDTQRTSAESLT